MCRQATEQEISDHLGFVPPFFTPAPDQAVLRSLWVQTRDDYLDNPLPGALKERLAVTMARYCGVPYCLVCHACSLVGLSGSTASLDEVMGHRLPAAYEVAELLRQVRSHTSSEQLAPEGWSALERLSLLLYSRAPGSDEARAGLREALSARTFSALVVFVAYNRTCHDWMLAHPDVDYAADARFHAHGDTIKASPTTWRTLRAVIDRADSPGPSVDAGELHATARLRRAELDRLFDARARKVLDDLAAPSDDPTPDLGKEILAIVCHDLRNPLSTIAGAGQLLERSHDPIARTAAQAIDRSVSTARRLVEDLLTFSEARTAQRLSIEPAPTDLAEALRRELADLALAHPHASLHGDLPDRLVARCDELRVRQAVGNLVSNAVVHGTVDLPVVVRLHSVAGQAAIEVCNAGSLPQELTGEALFEPFRRGEAQRSNGLGLGLFIARSIARSHGGDLTAHSADGQVRFTLTLDG
jgi:signal transduction histidine kinase